MKLSSGVFEELSKAEITLRTKGSRKTLSLLDLLDDNELDIQFNGCDTVSMYRDFAMIQYSFFKDDLGRLAREDTTTIYHTVRCIKSLIREVSMLLNPLNDDLVFSHVVIPRNPRFITDLYQINILRKKTLTYLGVQREILRLVKGSLKTFSKTYAPRAIVSYGKRPIPGQHTLFATSNYPKIPWKSETTKLVELVAALSESKVFGEEVSRKDLWNHFELVFDVSLQNAEKSLSQMKCRKIQQARFLDDLKDRFVHLMDKGSY